MPPERAPRSCTPPAPVPAAPPPTVAVVGLGLVGGSLARALVVAGVPVHGWAASAVDRRLAAASGVRVAPSLAAVADAAPAVVVLAVPLGALRGVCEALLPRLTRDALVLHVAGLQAAAATGLDAAAQARVLGTHPLAGTQEGGFAASRAHLFHECAVSAESRATPAERARLEWLWQAAGAGAVRYQPAAAHDRTMSWVSHLPQLAAVAMAAALDDAGVPSAAGGPGLRGATRLAASPLALWADLLHAAPPETDRALAALEAQVGALRAALRQGAAAGAGGEGAAPLAAVWTRAAGWRAGDAEGAHARA